MGDNAKALIGLGIVVVLAVVAYLAFGDNGVMAACVVGIVGLVGIFFLQRAADKREAEQETAYLEETVGDTPAPASGGGGGGGGLPTWSAEPLAPWTPPEDSGSAAEEPAYASFDSGLDDDAEIDTSTLDELAGFDDLDAVAEVESHTVAVDGDTGVEYEEVVEAEVEAEPVRTSLFSAPAPIREDVHSDDDILEASHATELHLDESDGGGSAAAGGNAELAKLLAKVQSRLAAYE